MGGDLKYNVINNYVSFFRSSMQLAVDATIPCSFGGPGGESIYIGKKDLWFVEEGVASNEYS